ncbi:MAG: Ig-like domain-containing protein [Myxococcaceae bacterium]|nr:Ig-like domain-containing protein [Myxococcaceae bacterium]
MSRRIPPALFFLLILCLAAAPACSEGESGDPVESDASVAPPNEDAQVAPEPDASEPEPDSGEITPEPDSGEPDPEPDSGEIDEPGDEVVYDVEVVSTWPTDGATDVPLTASIAVTFNQAMFPNSLTAASSNSDERDHNVALRAQGSGAAVAVTKKDGADKITFVYTPNAPLLAETTYTLTIRGGGDETEENDAARSQRRTRMAEDFSFSFTTASADAATEALEVTSITPADGSEDVPNTTRVTVTFNQPIQAATLYLVPDGQGASPKTQGTFWVSDSASFLFPEPGTLTVAEDMTSATFALNPGAALASGRAYHVGIKGCADTVNPANSPCLRALSGARLEDDFTASFTTAGARQGTIGELYELAQGLADDSESVATNLRIEGATMTYYRDVSNNEGFFIQREEEVDGETRLVGIYVNTLGRYPSIPVWPMFETASGAWMGDENPIVAEDERAAFAGYPVIDLAVTSVGTSDGMAFVKTDGFPTMSKTGERAIGEIIAAGEVTIVNQANKLVLADDLLGTLVMVEGKARYTGKQNSNSRVWFDLRWGEPIGGTIYDQVRKVRLLLSTDQMDLLGLTKTTEVDQATLRVLAPLQKGKFNDEQLLYVQPTKISSIECVPSQSGATETCGAVARSAAELDADPELMRDVVRVEEAVSEEE